MQETVYYFLPLILIVHSALFIYFICCCEEYLKHHYFNRCALETIDHLSESLDFTEFASRILQPLVRNLDTVPDLRPVSIYCIFILYYVVYLCLLICVK